MIQLIRTGVAAAWRFRFAVKDIVQRTLQYDGELCLQCADRVQEECEEVDLRLRGVLFWNTLAIAHLYEANYGYIRADAFGGSEEDYRQTVVARALRGTVDVLQEASDEDVHAFMNQGSEWHARRSVARMIVTHLELSGVKSHYMLSDEKRAIVREFLNENVLAFARRSA